MIYILDGQQFDRTLPEVRALPADERINIAKNAVFYSEDGKRLVGAQLVRMRSKVLGNNRGLEQRFRDAGRHREEPKMLIPGLLPWNAHPTLGAPPKVGKSMTVVAGLAAALTLPGMRFLDHFEPADLSMDPRYDRLNVAIVNAEMDPAAFEDMVWLAFGDRHAEVSVDGWREDRESAFPTIYHLREVGGPRMFDLTDPVIYDEWTNVLTQCYLCPDDEEPPSVFIVDGLTAVLAGAGKGPEAYGLWRAQFGQLLDDIGIPVSLVTAHTTLKADHLMSGVTSMAGPDGLWKLTKGRGGVREFSVPEPRHPAPVVKPIPLTMLPSGQIIERKKSETAEPPQSKNEAPPAVDITAVVVDFVTREHAEGRAPSGNEVLRGVGGRTDDIVAALKASVEAGRLVKQKRDKKGGGFEYIPADVE